MPSVSIFYISFTYCRLFIVRVFGGIIKLYSVYDIGMVYA
jgi:hypothetical protein